MAVLASCDPTIPVNSGLREAVDFVLPEGAVVNRAASGDRQSLFSDRASRLQHRALGARPAQSGARRGAVRAGLGRGHHRLPQIAQRQARGALRAAQHLARRHQPQRRRRRGHGDESLHPRRAGRDLRERVSAARARVRAHVRFRRRRPLPRRPGLCARIRGAGGQRADGALVEPPVRGARSRRRRQARDRRA